MAQLRGAGLRQRFDAAWAEISRHGAPPLDAAIYDLCPCAGASAVPKNPDTRWLASRSIAQSVRVVHLPQASTTIRGLVQLLQDTRPAPTELLVVDLQGR